MLLHDFFQVLLIWVSTLVILVCFSEMCVASCLKFVPAIDFRVVYFTWFMSKNVGAHTLISM